MITWEKVAYHGTQLIVHVCCGVLVVGGGVAIGSVLGMLWPEFWTDIGSRFSDF